jgi:hypothetical protein
MSEVNPTKALWEKGDFTQIAQTMREMNAYAAAAADGRDAELPSELEALVEEHNTGPSGEGTRIEAAFLRVTVAV